jgi:poly-gamma-glutamate synthesis protein (capsule biosynthesis protein)
MSPQPKDVVSKHAAPAEQERRPAAGRIKLFLCGDVMTGRGIDQILPQPSGPRLFEQYVRSAATYVEIAELASGTIPRRVAPNYIWGDALAELERARPDARSGNANCRSGR